MRIVETRFDKLFVIEPDRFTDERGFFARTFCVREFAERGLATEFVQCGTSYNARAGTVRGMHFQIPPHTETKLIRCTRGALLDTIVDIRQGATTYLESFSIELSADNGRLLYVPDGFAHGFQTLMDETEVFYHISSFYAPEAAAGLRWDDPALGIRWPLPVSVIGDVDRKWPLIEAQFRAPTR